MMNPDNKNVQRIGFILIPRFALMSYASAVEPLRAANLLAGRELYDVRMFSPEGGRVACSGGAEVSTLRLNSINRGFDLVFVCAGGEPSDWDYPLVLSCLRRLDREGVRIGGISGGPYLLAAAGLLAGKDFTIHWEHAAAVIEAFPSLQPRQARFVIDGNRITCGGGIAPLDLMHALISDRLGAEFARRVSDWYLHTHIAQPGAPQRGSLAERYRTHNPTLLMVLGTMEVTIERPLDRPTMAQLAGVSPRQLDRLFAHHLKTTFAAQYRNIRLQQAYRLLHQSPLSVSEIAFATGFASVAHFSRTFRAAFGASPRALRG